MLTFSVELDTAGVVGPMLARSRDFTPQLEAIGEDFIAAVQDNFTRGGFQQLAPSTVRYKLSKGRTAQPIIFDGTWRREHHTEVSPLELMVATTSPYAVYHVSDAPRTKIPLRNPYTIAAEDRADAATRLAHYMATGEVT